MPLCFSSDSGEQKIAIWQITESQEYFEETFFTKIQDAQFNPANINSKLRCIQGLAARHALHYLLSDAISINYTPTGKPYLENDKRFISFSHSHLFAGVILSSSPAAIDIEAINRPVGKLAAKFMSTNEQQDFFNNEILVWCCKEVMFKNAGIAEIDFKKDLKVYNINGRLSGKHFKESKENCYNFEVRKLNDIIFVWGN